MPIVCIWLQEMSSVNGFCCVSQFGSAVKLPGSGGAVVGLCLDSAKLVRLPETAGLDLRFWNF